MIPSPRYQDTYHVFAKCNVCGEPLICDFYGSSPQTGYLHDDDDVNPLQGGFMLTKVMPAPIKSISPDHLDPTVLAPFVDAERCLEIDLPNPAAFSIRRSLEMGLRIAEKNLTGANSGNTPYQITKDLAMQGHLTKSLADWANHIRLEGNKAVHGDDYSIEDARALIEFARLLFTYLFTLPKELELIQARQAAQTP